MNVLRASLVSKISNDGKRLQQNSAKVQIKSPEAIFRAKSSARVMLARRSSSSSGPGLQTSTGNAGCNRNPITANSVSLLASAITDAEAVVEVDLGDRSYPIYIGNELPWGELLKKHISGSSVLIVTNETIAPLYLDRCIDALKEEEGLRVESVILPDGEEYKNMETLMMVYDKALQCRLDRKTTFLALGGGVIGDMTGYAAASYQRGVNFVQVPTTLMAMVDSSVGGKTGVNHPLGKNMIGAFYQPQCVMIDTSTLDTLPLREHASGIAEVVKYGLIKDADFFVWQEENMEKLLNKDPATLIYAVERSCINKAEVVAADEKEAGVRATLNLGHTFGHAVETNLGYGEWLHGEAVSVGMCMAADMSRRLGWITPELEKRTIDLLKRAQLPIKLPEGLGKEDFMATMAVDKKVANGVLRLILLTGELGGCVFTSDFNREMLDETLEEYCAKD